MNDSTNIKLIVDNALDKIEETIGTSPFFAVIAAHHLFRNLYPSDPYIKVNNNLNINERVKKAAVEVVELIELSEKLGNYQKDSSVSIDFSIQNENLVRQTGEIYGSLWREFNFENVIKEAKEILQQRFTANGYNLADIAKGQVLDAGCGSGRYTLALVDKCESIIGLDYGDEGLQLAKNSLSAYPLSVKEKVKFQKGDLIDLPFPDETFDFVFSNGTAHHTINPIKAIEEIIRVTKKNGSIFLYLYGSGGVFWHARKRMNKFMKRIPPKDTRDILKSMGMPSNRFIFEDNWYVPIENHMARADVEKIFEQNNIDFDFLKSGRDTDLTPSNSDEFELWGEGELRWIIQK